MAMKLLKMSAEAKSRGELHRINFEKHSFLMRNNLDKYIQTAQMRKALDQDYGKMRLEIENSVSIMLDEIDAIRISFKEVNEMIDKLQEALKDSR